MNRSLGAFLPELAMFGSSRQLQDTDHIAFLGAEVEEEDREEQGGFEHEEKTLPV